MLSIHPSVTTEIVSLCTVFYIVTFSHMIVISINTFLHCIEGLEEYMRDLSIGTLILCD